MVRSRVCFCAGRWRRRRVILTLPVTDGEKLAGIITLRDIRRAEACGVDTSVGSDMRVEKLCSRDIYIVSPQEPLANVVRQMAERYIGSALVARNGRLAGIFTSSDALKRYADLLSGTAPRRRVALPSAR